MSRLYGKATADVKKKELTEWHCLKRKDLVLMGINKSGSGFWKTHPLIRFRGTP
jgi:hypothetical protein